MLRLNLTMVVFTRKCLGLEQSLLRLLSISIQIHKPLLISNSGNNDCWWANPPPLRLCEADAREMKGKIRPYVLLDC